MAGTWNNINKLSNFRIKRNSSEALSFSNKCWIVKVSNYRSIRLARAFANLMQTNNFTILKVLVTKKGFKNTPLAKLLLAKKMLSSLIFAVILGSSTITQNCSPNMWVQAALKWKLGMRVMLTSLLVTSAIILSKTLYLNNPLPKSNWFIQVTSPVKQISLRNSSFQLKELVLKANHLWPSRVIRTNL